MTIFEGICTTVRNAVTIDTHRHGSISEGHGNHYERVPGRGAVRRQRGSALPRGSDSPVSKERPRSDKESIGPAGPYGTL